MWGEGYCAGGHCPARTVVFLSRQGNALGMCSEAGMAGSIQQARRHAGWLAGGHLAGDGASGFLGLSRVEVLFLGWCGVVGRCWVTTICTVLGPA